MKKEIITVTVTTNGQFYGEVEREYEDDFFVINEMYLNERVNIQVTDRLENLILQEDDMDLVLEDYSYDIGYNYTMSSLYEHTEYGVEHIHNQSYSCDIEVENFDKTKLKLSTHLIGGVKSITLEDFKYDDKDYKFELGFGTGYREELSSRELKSIFMCEEV